MVIRTEDKTPVRVAHLVELAGRRGVPVRQVEVRHAHRYFSTRTPQGVAALVHRPPPRSLETHFVPGGRVLVLDGLQDPGNAGTLTRTAWLLHWDAVLMTRGSVSPWNEKAVRASAGAIAYIPVALADADEIRTAGEAAGYQFILASAAEGKTLPAVSLKGGLCLVLGSEARGAESEWPGAITVTIPIRSGKGLDSLGVVASGAVLLERYRRGD